jgi:hypothetical protein
MSAPLPSRMTSLPPLPKTRSFSPLAKIRSPEPVQLIVSRRFVPVSVGLIISFCRMEDGSGIDPFAVIGHHPDQGRPLDRAASLASRAMPTCRACLFVMPPP